MGSHEASLVHDLREYADEDPDSPLPVSRTLIRTERSGEDVQRWRWATDGLVEAFDGDGDGDFEETYSWTDGKLDTYEDHEAARPSTVRWGIEWDGDNPVRREVLRWGELERAEERRWADGRIQEMTTDEDGDSTPDAVETWVWSYD